jgi:hypothetical protein
MSSRFPFAPGVVEIYRCRRLAKALHGLWQALWERRNG